MSVCVCRYVFNAAAILASNVTVKSHQTVLLRLWSQRPPAFRRLLVHFHVENTTLFRPLPVTKVTPWVSYVTTPLFNGVDGLYPRLHDGTFYLSVNHSQVRPRLIKNVDVLVLCFTLNVLPTTYKYSL
jgi:hypothetical protein